MASGQVKSNMYFATCAENRCRCHVCSGGDGDGGVSWWLRGS